MPSGPVPVDEDGMVVSAGIKRCPKARAAYVTPSHQYPLGATMSAGRRMQLLNWAQNAGSWIIEDDYDSEYRFESAPISSLQGLDRNARVIYIGTFSKVLFPSLRLGYIVIPEDLVDHFSAVRSAMDIFPPYLYQEAITDFMREGHFARHIRKMRLLYGERRTALVNSIRDQLGPELEIHGTQAGMHLAVTLPKGLSDLEIAKKAAAKGSGCGLSPRLIWAISTPGFDPGIWQYLGGRNASRGQSTSSTAAGMKLPGSGLIGFDNNRPMVSAFIKCSGKDACDRSRGRLRDHRLLWGIMERQGPVGSRCAVGFRAGGE